MLPHLSACGPGISQAGQLSGSSQVTASSESQGDAAQSKSRIPAPPPPVSEAPGGGRLLKEHTASGLTSCIAERRDLGRHYLRWSVQAALTAEERLALREWVIAAADFPEGTSLQSCDDALLCAWLPRADIQASIKKLGRALSNASSQTFFSQHLKTSNLADELKENAPHWRLYTAAVTVLNQDTAPVAHGNESSEDVWLRVIRDAGGKKAISTLGLQTMRRAAALALADSLLVIAGPSSPKTMSLALARGLETQATTNSAESHNAQPAPNTPAIERPALLRIDDDAELSTGMMVWKPARGTQAALILSLRLLIERWNQRGTAHATLSLSPSRGLQPWPSLSIEGGYQNVESAISELQTLSDELRSASGLPKKSEFEAALGFHNSPSIEPRCSMSAPNSTNLTPQELQKALIAAGPPAVLIMGQAESAAVEDD